MDQIAQQISSKLYDHKPSPQEQAAADELRSEADRLEREGKSSSVGDFARGWDAALAFIVTELRERAEAVEQGW